MQTTKKEVITPYTPKLPKPEQSEFTFIYINPEVKSKSGVYKLFRLRDQDSTMFLIHTQLQRPGFPDKIRKAEFVEIEMNKEIWEIFKAGAIIEVDKEGKDISDFHLQMEF